MRNAARKFRVKRIAANEIQTNNLFVNGNAVAGGLALGSSEVVDLNGEADALVLDADGDTTISAPTDDQIDIELKSVDQIVLKAVATADSGATTNIMEIAATTPVDTTGTNEHNALNIDLEIGNASGGTNTVNAIKIDNITGDAQVVETGLMLGTGFDVGIDMQGTKIDLDDAGTTSITADTDNQIDIEIGGADDFQFTANTFTALSGSTIETDTIAETTSAAGVTVDGVLIKDGGIVCADAATLEIDTVNEATSAAGVTVDGVLIKDTAITARTAVAAVTDDGAIAVPVGNVTYFITEDSDGAAMTLVDPTATTHDGVTLTFIATTAHAHSLDNSAGSGFNGGGAGADVGTFGGGAGDMLQIVAYQGVWYIIINTNVSLG